MNLVPIKEFEGVKFRSYYQRPEDGKRGHAIFCSVGKSWNNGISYVGAVETYLVRH